MARRARQGVVRVAGLVMAATLAACGGGGADDSTAGPAPEATFAVGTRFETLVDRSRPTNAIADSEAKPERTFETLVTYPAAGAPGRPASPGAPAAPGGPFPLVLFSHGSGVSSPARYELLFNAWAAAGYVIAAPKYPLSSTSLPNASGDAVNQPADVSFLISEMVRLGADRTSPYAGLVDGERVAVAGHSLGAATTLGVAFNGCCVDRRIDAGIVMAGGEAFFPTEQWFTESVRRSWSSTETTTGSCDLPTGRRSSPTPRLPRRCSPSSGATTTGRMAAAWPRRRTPNASERL